MTFLNSFCFTLPLVPLLLRNYKQDPTEIQQLWNEFRHKSQKSTRIDSGDSIESDPMLKSTDSLAAAEQDSTPLTLKQIIKRSLEFSSLWFFANYFAIACLEYTTVGSATIITSTSSIWTLLVGTIVGVERFTLKKLLGVLASVFGIILISSIDVSSDDNEDRGTFPRKSAREIAIGDVLAIVSAVIYGFYVVVLKQRIGDESRVNMPLFFGFVGTWNVLLMWPGFFLLHFTNIESFQLPPTRFVLVILLCNAASSLLSDFCWAYAMLLTSPLVVTVGLSLTIPLSLVGQMVLSGLYMGISYWFGAAVVVASFIFINHEVKDEEVVAITESGILRSEIDFQA